MAVYGYARVSTDRQADEGVSLEAQERTLRGYAMMSGLDLTRVYVERGVSGSTPLGERPEGAKLLASVRPGDIVLTPKLDRMFRSSLNALNVLDRLRAMRVSLHRLDLGGDVTGNGISKLVFTILSAVAEAERDRIRERIVDVKRDQRQQGRYLGGIPPFGYARGDAGELVPITGEQEIVTRITSMRRDGAPLRRIQAAIEQDHGRRLSLDALARLARDEVETSEDCLSNQVEAWFDADPRLRRKGSPDARRGSRTKYSTRYETKSGKDVVLVRQSTNKVTIFIAKNDLSVEKLAYLEGVERYEGAYGATRSGKPARPNQPGYNSNAALVFGNKDVYEFEARTVEKAARIVDAVVCT